MVEVLHDLNLMNDAVELFPLLLIAEILLTHTVAVRRRCIVVPTLFTTTPTANTGPEASSSRERCIGIGAGVERRHGCREWLVCAK